LNTVNIEWLSDSTDCDQAGCSGGYSTGAIVKLDGTIILELIPVAACFGGDSWDREDVWAMILEKLVGNGNLKVEQSYG
jgi:hypothetical protein